MAWNEKAARKIMAQQQRRSLDAIDLEAERQGNAMRYFKANEIGPRNLGRRISRETRQLDGRRKTVDAKATRNLVHDTAIRAKQLIVAA